MCNFLRLKMVKYYTFTEINLAMIAGGILILYQTATPATRIPIEFYHIVIAFAWRDIRPIPTI